MEYKFVKYNPSYLSSLIELLTRSFAIENTDKIKLVKWKYFDPFFQNRSFTYITLDGKNNVVGHYSSMPISIQNGRKTYKTTLSTDAAVDRNHRGKGLMSKMASLLYKDVRDNGYDFSFGYPNEVGVVMDKHSKNYGYRIVGKFVKYITFVFIQRNVSYSLSRVPSSDLLEDLESEYGNFLTIKKDKAHLCWRYFKKPNNDYRIYRINFRGKIVGYVVLRFTRFKCYVYDIITSDIKLKHLKNVFYAIENKALDENARFVVYSVLDNAYWQKLFRFPYVKKFYDRSHYYFSIHHHNGIIDPNIFNKDKWILMSGDIL